MVPNWYQISGNLVPVQTTKFLSSVGGREDSPGICGLCATGRPQAWRAEHRFARRASGGGTPTQELRGLDTLVGIEHISITISIRELF